MGAPSTYLHKAITWLQSSKPSFLLLVPIWPVAHVKCGSWLGAHPMSWQLHMAQAVIFYSMAYNKVALPTCVLGQPNSRMPLSRSDVLLPVEVVHASHA